MSQYISRATLSVNSKNIADFESVKELERELRATVNLMHKTGFTKKTPRYNVDVTYVVPAGPKVDWDAVENGTLTIEDDDGGRTTYSGVCTLKVGEADRKGDGAVMQVITLAATERIKE